jgi:hypothetical protein
MIALQCRMIITSYKDLYPLLIISRMMQINYNLQVLWKTLKTKPSASIIAKIYAEILALKTG